MIKRGIMEVADVVVVNKADGETDKAATRAASEYGGCLHLMPHRYTQHTTTTHHYQQAAAAHNSATRRGKGGGGPGSPQLLGLTGLKRVKRQGPGGGGGGGGGGGAPPFLVVVV